MNLKNLLSKKQSFALLGFFIINTLICVYLYSMLLQGINSSYILKLMTFTNFKLLMGAYTILSTMSLGTFFILFNRNIYNLKNKNLIVILFFFIMLISVLVMITLGCLTHGETIRSMLHNNKNDVFMDYFNSIQYGTHPYQRQVIYPPLINILYGFLGRFFIKDGLATPLYRVNQLASMTFLFYSMATYGFLYYAFNKISKEFFNQLEVKLLFIILLFSLPYLYLMERANSLIIVISLLMLFCVLYDSHNRTYKWLSMIVLGIAASIKITPCIFGLLYLRDKNFKSALKCFAIGVLIFNVPFMLTDGNLFVLIDNIRNTTQAFQGINVNEYGFPHYVGNGHYVNLGNTITILSRCFDYNLASFGKYFNIIVFCTSVLIILFSKQVKSWQVMLLLCGVIVLCPGFSAIYNLTYYTIPLVYFLGSKPNINIKNIIYLLLFALIFIPVINIKIPYFQYISWTDLYPIRLSTIIESFSILLLSLGVIIDVLRQEYIAIKGNY